MEAKKRVGSIGGQASARPPCAWATDVLAKYSLFGTICMRGNGTNSPARRARHDSQGGRAAARVRREERIKFSTGCCCAARASSASKLASTSQGKGQSGQYPPRRQQAGRAPGLLGPQCPPHLTRLRQCSSTPILRRPQEFARARAQGRHARAPGCQRGLRRCRGPVQRPPGSRRPVASQRAAQCRGRPGLRAPPRAAPPQAPRRRPLRRGPCRRCARACACRSRGRAG